jgi:hypothetical protein
VESSLFAQFLSCRKMDLGLRKMALAYPLRDATLKSVPASRNTPTTRAPRELHPAHRVVGDP